MRWDVHQHLLSEPLVEALALRRKPPLLRRRRDGWTFRVAGEPDSVLAAAAVDVSARHRQLGEDGVDRALVALSAALGIETLPGEEAAELIAAHLAGAEALPSEFGAWGAVALERPDAAAVETLLDRGCVGLSLPATALAGPEALPRVAPLLAVLERRGAPLFVHPGPVAAALDSPSTPAWWPALTDYVAQMQAAWFAFLLFGRPAHPRLRVLFAMLAGGAPLQFERYRARGGELTAPADPLCFYDTSSYGPRMVGAVAEAVGAGQLVYGSDRPVAAAPPGLDPERERALRSLNPARLFSPSEPKGAPA